MLYLLYEWLKDGDAARYLNFLKYPTFRIVAGFVSSLLIGMLIGPRLIDRLRIAQYGISNVREDTPESHQKKKGTPTLGGSLILLGVFFGTLLFADLKSRVVLVALLMAVVLRERRILLTVNQFFTAGQVVAASDLVMVLPRHLIEATGMTNHLVSKPLPFNLPDVHIDMLWHERDARSPGHRWLREQLRDSVAFAKAAAGTS